MKLRLFLKHFAIFWTRERCALGYAPVFGALVGCNLLGGSSSVSTAYHPGLGAPFTADWAMSSSTNYTYNSSSIDFSNGVAELTAASQTDNSSTLFNAGTFTGGALYDSSNGYLRLSSINPNLELDSSWAPAWSNLVSYWKLDESSGASYAVDSVGANAGTPHGGVVFGASGKLNNAASFNGSTGYIDVGSELFSGNAPFTAAGWIYPSVNSAVTYQTLVGEGFYNGTNQNGWYIRLRASTQSPANTIELTRGNGATAQYVVGNVQILAGGWYHIAFTYDGTTMKLYVNGALDNSAASSVSIPSSGVGNLRIGLYDTNSYMQGYVDDVAVWNTALSTSAINSLYQHEAAKYAGTLTSRVMDGLATGRNRPTLSWTPTLPFFKELPDYANGAVQNELSSSYSSLEGDTPAAGDNNLMNGIVGLWHMDETSGTVFTDHSGQNNTATVQAGVPGFVAGKIGGAVNFNGSTYATVPNAASLNLSTAWTIQAWVNQQGTPGQGAMFFGDGFGGTVQYCLGYCGSAQTSVISAGVYSAAWYNSPTYALTNGQWTHVVGVYSSSAHTLTLYINGNSVGTTTGIPSAVANSGQPARMAERWDGSDYFVGMIDEVAVWSKTLNAAEVLELYRRGANRVRYQVRSCNDSNCVAGSPSWLGPDGTSQSYFTELNNNAVPNDGADLAGSDSVQAGLPVLSYSSFPSLNLSTQRYFQYRAIMESDDANTLCNYGGGPGTAPCSPELKNVTVGTANYDSSGPTIVNKAGMSYTALMNLIETLGPSGCLGGTLYNLSSDNSHWYYWTGAAWGLAVGTTATANSASTIAAHASSFATQVGSGTIYFKAFLQSSGTSPCQLQNLEIDGFH